jgi:Kef-type K+ transport system membrane component KefB/mannitol/fructose-specific phosphotransferase system IIA component (Ntr-type)
MPGMTHLAETPLLVLAIVLAAGALGGSLARRVRLPSVTGQILVGVLLGPSVLHVLGHEATAGLVPFIHFALGLIAVDVGTHLHLRRMRNQFRRLGLLLAAEVVLIPLLVYVGLVTVGGRDWTFGMLMGMLAISTAPATVLAIVKETRSKGVFVRTLVAAVALNNLACIALFGMAYTAVKVTLDPGGADSVVQVLAAPLIQLGGAALLGGGLGLCLVFASRHMVQPEQITTVSIISIFLATGLADLLGLSNLLACLFLGVTMVNLAPEKEEIGHRVFANFDPAVLAVFFTLAGLELDFAHLRSAWFLVVVFVVARGLGKILAGGLAMQLAGATDNVQRWLGTALLPQAGVAVGLLLQVREDPVFGDMGPLVLAVGVTAVAINEVIGPLTTRLALARSGNLGMNRERLIDFIHEENIITDFRARTTEDAVRQLVDLLVTSHGLDQDREELVRSVMAREERRSTCIGRGLAVPHATLESGGSLVGVMGVSREGLVIETPDGLPIRCMVLMLAPSDQTERRREVRSALARSVGSDWNLQIQLFHASSPAHVYEILHAEEAQDFNYFLDDGDFEAH